MFYSLQNVIIISLEVVMRRALVQSSSFALVRSFTSGCLSSISGRLNSELLFFTILDLLSAERWAGIVLFCLFCVKSFFFWVIFLFKILKIESLFLFFYDLYFTVSQLDVYLRQIGLICVVEYVQPCLSHFLGEFAVFFLLGVIQA